MYNDTWSWCSLGNYNEASVAASFGRSYLWDNILTYSKDLGDHTLSGTFLTSWSKGINENYSASGRGQAVPNQLFYNLGATDAASRVI